MTFISISDVLKKRWSKIYDGRLHYRMGKNSKLLSLKIPFKIDKILEQYICNRNNDDDFIFPELKKANHPLMLQKQYHHSDLKTTINYQANFIHTEADDALESVINF